MKYMLFGASRYENAWHSWDPIRAVIVVVVGHLDAGGICGVV